MRLSLCLSQSLELRLEQKLELKLCFWRVYVNRTCPSCGSFPSFCWYDRELWCESCRHTWKSRGSLKEVYHLDANVYSCFIETQAEG